MYWLSCGVVYQIKGIILNSICSKNLSKHLYICKELYFWQRRHQNKLLLDMKVSHRSNDCLLKTNDVPRACQSERTIIRAVINSMCWWENKTRHIIAYNIRLIISRYETSDIRQTIHFWNPMIRRTGYAMLAVWLQF